MRRTAPLICALVLAGCGGGEDQRRAATPTATAAPQAGEVTYCVGEVYADAERAAVARFNEGSAGHQARVRVLKGDADAQRSALVRRLGRGCDVLLDGAGSKVVGEFGVSALPRFDDRKPSGLVGGQVLAVAAGPRSKPAALALIDFLTSEDEVERAIEFAAVPPLKAAFDAPDIGASIPSYAELERMLKVARPRPATPYWPQFSQAIYTAVHAVLSGRLSPEAALDRADERIDRVLRS